MKENIILKSYPNDYFVETGTAGGRSVATAIALGFKEIHSIELNPSLHKRANNAFKEYPCVHIHHGDSKTLLPQIIANITDKPITFWLDAHYYKESEYRHTGPLSYELEAIKQHPRKDHTLLIDDLNHMPNFGFTRENLTSALKEINPDYRVFRHITNGKETKVLVATL